MKLEKIIHFLSDKDIRNFIIIKREHVANEAFYYVNETEINKENLRNEALLAKNYLLKEDNHINNARIKGRIDKMSIIDGEIIINCNYLYSAVLEESLFETVNDDWIIVIDGIKYDDIPDNLDELLGREINYEATEN